MDRRVRKYRSPRREAQAAQTRADICAAARALIARHGLAGTTIETIAREAGVAVQTVYAVFGSKAAILSAILDQFEGEADLADLAANLARSTSPLEELRAVVAYNRRLFDRAGDFIAAAEGSVASDPDVATHVAEGHRRRRASQRGIVERWAARGALREGMTRTTATDILWTFTSPSVHRLLVAECGWSSSRYERWVVQVLGGQLMGAGGRPPRSSRREGVRRSLSG